MNLDAAAQKAELRKLMRAEARKHSDSEQAAASSALCELLKVQPLWRDARCILFYAAMAGEPNIEPLARAALAIGKTVAFPRYVAATSTYEARTVSDLSAHFVQGQYGIKEPLSSCPIVPWNKLDLALVPGIAFSLTGRRLGRGKGHYDCFLSEVEGNKCGVAFDWQVAVEVPAARHDVPLDCILTPTRWHIVGS